MSYRKTYEFTTILLAHYPCYAIRNYNELSLRILIAYLFLLIVCIGCAKFIIAVFTGYYNTARTYVQRNMYRMEKIICDDLIDSGRVIPLFFSNQSIIGHSKLLFNIMSWWFTIFLSFFIISMNLSSNVLPSSFTRSFPARWHKQ